MNKDPDPALDELETYAQGLALKMSNDIERCLQKGIPALCYTVPTAPTKQNSNTLMPKKDQETQPKNSSKKYESLRKKNKPTENDKPKRAKESPKLDTAYSERIKKKSSPTKMQIIRTGQLKGQQDWYYMDARVVRTTPPAVRKTPFFADQIGSSSHAHSKSTSSSKKKSPKKPGSPKKLTKEERETIIQNKKGIHARLNPYKEPVFFNATTTPKMSSQPLPDDKRKQLKSILKDALEAFSRHFTSPIKKYTNIHSTKGNRCYNLLKVSANLTKNIRESITELKDTATVITHANLGKYKKVLEVFSSGASTAMNAVTIPPLKNKLGEERKYKDGTLIYFNDTEKKYLQNQLNKLIDGIEKMIQTQPPIDASPSSEPGK